MRPDKKNRSKLRRVPHHAPGLSYSDADHSARSLAEWLKPASAFLVASLLIWAFLVPVDATSVFEGQALPQNLFWLLAACLCAAAAALKGGLGFKRSEWLVCGFALIWLLLITACAGFENNPRRAWNGFWQVIALASSYLCIRSLDFGPESRAALWAICLVGCLATSVQGLYQVSVVFPHARAAYERDPDQELSKIPGLYAPPGSPQRARFEDRLYSHEPYATYALANSLATVLSAGVLLLASVMLTLIFNQRHGSRLPIGRSIERENGDDARWDRLPGKKQLGWHRLAIAIGLFSLALMLICWLLTRSRAAYVAVAACAVLWIGLNYFSSSQRKIRGKQLIAGGLLCLLFFGVGIGWIVLNDELVIREASKSLGYRIQYWQSTLRMIWEHPWLGVGLGNFQSYYPYYKLPTASEEIADPHNWVLDIAATLSLPIAFMVMGWLMISLLSGSRFWRNVQSPSIGELATDERMQVERHELDGRCRAAIVWGAGLGGTICGLLAWLLSGHDPWEMLICWLPAAVLVAFLWPGLLSQTSTNRLGPRMAALSMLVCLMASGSWQASGIAIPLLLLLATSRAFVDMHRGRWFCLVLPVLGLACFLFQAWLPVTRAWSLRQQAMLAENGVQQLALARQAINADPLDTEAQSWVIQAQVAQATLANRFEFERLSSHALNELDAWLERDHNHFTNWRQAGNLTFELCEAADRLGLDVGPLYRRAVDYYQRAVERYPGSAELRLQLAAAATLTQQWELSQEQAEQAIQLSEATPHLDKKLENQLIWFPFSGLSDKMRSATSGMVKAEPLLEWIRNQRTQLPDN